MSNEEARRIILGVICRSEAGLTFREIIDEVEKEGAKLRKIEIRETLSKLIRSGDIERVADYERRRMVFRAKSRC